MSRKFQAVGIDAHEMLENLWQGSLPDEGGYLASLGFEVLVLCAKEYQPGGREFPGLTVVHAPYDDDSSREISQYELDTAVKAARAVARAVKQGKPTLVTCVAGRNRSGLVVALAMHKLTGMAGVDIVKRIKAKRPLALTNLGFRKLVEQIRAVTPQ